MRLCLMETPWEVPVAAPYEHAKAMPAALGAAFRNEAARRSFPLTNRQINAAIASFRIISTIEEL
jgi:hypothetical protein